jgi:hypothetical protein
MECPFCRHVIIDHQACWEENWLGRQRSFLFTNVEEETHTVEGNWQTKTVSINGRELTGRVFLDFMRIDPLWDWEDTQANFEEELASWDEQFRWGDGSDGTFFLSQALQRWITMRMSLMQQYFGLDHGIGHFMLFEVDSEAQAPAPLRPKSPQTSSAASDRKSAPQPWFRQAG